MTSPLPTTEPQEAAMTTMQPVPRDHPLMLAWKSFQATGQYQNAVRWGASNPTQYLEGALWAAFEAGFNKPPAAPPPSEPKERLTARLRRIREGYDAPSSPPSEQELRDALDDIETAAHDKPDSPYRAACSRIESLFASQNEELNRLSAMIGRYQVGISQLAQIVEGK